MIEVQVPPVSGKIFMVRLPDLDEHVTGNSTSRGGIALAPKVELHAVLHTSRDLNFHDRFLAAQAMLVCVLRLGFDRLSQTSTSGASRGGLHLPQNRVADLTDLARSAALPTGIVFDALGLDQSEDLDLFGHAFGNLFEGQLHLDAQVGSFGAARTSRAAATERIPECPAEDVSELAEDVVHVHAGTALGCATHSGVAEPVILGPLLLVAEDLIRFSRLFEAAFGIGVIRVFVRVILDGQLPVSLLDVGFGGSRSTPRIS